MTDEQIAALRRCVIRGGERYPGRPWPEAGAAVVYGGDPDAVEVFADYFAPVLAVESDPGPDTPRHVLKLARRESPETVVRAAFLGPDATEENKPVVAHGGLVAGLDASGEVWCRYVD